ATRVAAAAANRLAVSVGIELLRFAPGYVAPEVDGKLSFNVAASVATAHQIIDADRQIALPRMNRGIAVMWPGDYSLVKPTTGQFTRFPVVFTGPPTGLTSKPDALLASRSPPSVISLL